MATFDIDSPDQSLPVQMAVKVREFQYGDGYTQSVADGINNLTQEFNVAFSNRSQATIQAIDDFLRGQVGAWFFWTTPRGETLRFKCFTWVPNYETAPNCSLTAKFMQTFEL